MKKFQIIVIVLLAASTLCCCKNTEEQETPTDQVGVTDTLTAEKPNELYGTEFSEISEVPELSEYEFQARGLVDNQATGKYKYWISKYANDKNYLVIFQELSEKTNKPNPKYKILDTLNIPQKNIEEHVAICTCRQNKIADNEIIALVTVQSSDDAEYSDHILKAWRVDTKTQKIVLIEDIKGIDCINEAYGL